MLSETHLTDEISDNEMHINNFHLYRTDSTSRHTGGVAIYVHESIQVLHVDKIVISMNFWLLEIKLKLNEWCVSVACVYHSPNSCHNIFIGNLDDWLQENNERNEKIILFGDMNINWCANTVAKRKISDSIFDNNMQQMVKNYTRINKESKSLIDYCVSNVNGLIVRNSLENNISDHECLICECKIKRNNDTSKYKQIEYIKEYEQNELLNELSKVDWSVSTSLNLNEKCEFLENSLKISIQKFVKIKRIPIDTKCKWFDENLSDMKRERDIAYKRAAISKSADDWSRYKVMRNNYVNRLNLNESQYYKRKIQENSGDNRNMWKTPKQVMGNKQRGEIKAICFGDTLENDERVMAEKLNAFFVDSIRNISESIPNVALANVMGSGAVQLECTFAFQTVCANDIEAAIKQINSKGDLEKITPKVLLDALPVISNIFCDIINESLMSGAFPDWKCSIITPIEKVAASTKPEDMRPINNMKTMEKVLEIVVKKQLDKYVNDNNILVECQSGFRKNHSCETAINHVIQNWKDEIEKNKSIICIFLDLKRAFETIDRFRLIQKLLGCGIRNKEIRWFESFINNRKQKKEIENDKVKLRTISD